MLRPFNGNEGSHCVGGVKLICCKEKRGRTNSVLQRKTGRVTDPHSVQMRYKIRGGGDELIARQRHNQECQKNGACCPFHRSAFLHAPFFSSLSSLRLCLSSVRQWGNPGWEECSDKVKRRASDTTLNMKNTHFGLEWLISGTEELNIIWDQKNRSINLKKRKMWLKCDSSNEVRFAIINLPC